jgi:UDP-3-O-[3-hydroxymyristoyl] glucosamine N-acyltransferase
MIDSSAIVHPGARIGKDVEIGPFTVVHANVEIGDQCVIHEHCVIGARGPQTTAPLVLGPRAIIRSHTVVYQNSTIGPRLETGHHVVIRERSQIGENLRVGNFSDIEGDCTIGDFARFHGYVHVGKGGRIGSFVWLFSLTTATNDPLPPSSLADPVHIDDGAVVCVGATLMPGCRIGKGAFVSAGAMASGDIPKGAVVSGPAGTVVNHVSRLMNLAGGLRHPWMRHYRSVYPEHAQERLDALLVEVLENRQTLKLGGTT